MIFCPSSLCAVAARLVSIITLGTFQKLDTCYAATSRDQSRAAPAAAPANFMNERKYEEDEERGEEPRSGYNIIERVCQPRRRAAPAEAGAEHRYRGAVRTRPP